MTAAVPWFVRHLPQRAAALVAIGRFAAENGFAVPEVEERMAGRRTVHFVGTSPDGREFGIGYEWTPKQLARYVPRQPQPNFTGSARWPADVLVPLRKVPRR